MEICPSIEHRQHGALGNLTMDPVLFVKSGTGIAAKSTPR